MGTPRQYSSEFKAKIILQALTGEKSDSEQGCNKSHWSKIY
jgi:transposase-like protein